MAAGMKDVASLAGVAIGTVSNVLNHPELVRPQTRARVEAAMEQLGFIPNASARQLRVGRGSCLGLVVLDVRNPFFTEVARGVEDYAQAQGYAVILCNSDEAEDKERRYLRVLEEQRVRGILITPVHGSARPSRASGTAAPPWFCWTGQARPVTARWPWTTGVAVNWPSPTCWPSATAGSPWSTGRWPSASAPTAGAALTTR